MLSYVFIECRASILIVSALEGNLEMVKERREKESISALLRKFSDLNSLVYFLPILFPFMFIHLVEWYYTVFLFFQDAGYYVYEIQGVYWNV